MITNILNEMAVLYDFNMKNTDYYVEIHGGNNNERALPPHIHLYGYRDGRLIENIEFSLSYYLENNIFQVIRIDNYIKHIHINNRRDCSWYCTARLYDKVEHKMLERPVNGRYRGCIDYIQAAIDVWNHETDPKTIRKELQNVPEPYRIIIAMREMNKTISIKNKRKYFKGIDIDKVIEEYYIPNRKRRK